MGSGSLTPGFAVAQPEDVQPERDGRGPTVSVVVPVYNEHGNLERLYGEIAANLAGETFEVVFVDDGSTDDSLVVIEELAARYDTVRYLSFSRNFGHQAALRAGLAEARGDAVISMDADLQHPPSLLPEMIATWREGYDVVYTVRDDSAAHVGWFKRVSSGAFYRLLNFLTDLSIEPGAADFRLLARRACDEVNAQQETDLFLRGYIQWIGFRQKGLKYVPEARFSGESKYSLARMLSLAASGLTQFSVRPLRLAYLFAIGAFAIAIAYVAYAIVVGLTGSTAPGWLSVISLLVFLQGVQFLLIGLVGEYLGRTFMQSKHRPQYIVARRR
jgi:glycosyltransferase involved in cell wall biosynthesis